MEVYSDVPGCLKRRKVVQSKATGINFFFFPPKKKGFTVHGVFYSGFKKICFHTWTKKKYGGITRTSFSRTFVVWINPICTPRSIDALERALRSPWQRHAGLSGFRLLQERTPQLLPSTRTVS